MWWPFFKITHYYRSQSRFTDPGKFVHLFENLPTSIIELVKIAQGVVIDKDLIELYGESISDEQKNDPVSRYVETILKLITDRNSSPLSVERSPKERFVGSCRDYVQKMRYIADTPISNYVSDVPFQYRSLTQGLKMVIVFIKLVIKKEGYETDN